MARMTESNSSDEQPPSMELDAETEVPTEAAVAANGAQLALAEERVGRFGRVRGQLGLEAEELHPVGAGPRAPRRRPPPTA